jgi:hypothetical protein
MSDILRALTIDAERLLKRCDSTAPTRGAPLSYVKAEAAFE